MRLGSGECCIAQSLRVLVMHVQLPRCHHVTEVLDLAGEPLAFLKVECHAGLTYPREDLVHIFDVLFCRVREDDDVV